MAELVGGALLGEAVSRVSSAIIAGIQKTWSFKSQLAEMKERVESMRPIAERLDKLNKQLDGLNEKKSRLTSMLKQAEVLVEKCTSSKLYQYPMYASKLDKMNESLQEYVKTDLQLQTALDTKETLGEVRYLKRRREKGSSSGWRTSGPLLKGDAIGFDSRVTELKGKVLKDSPKGDCSVVVVSAMGGSGKTTLVTLFCRDPEIQRRFDGNIYHVTVTERYDIKVIITKLLGPLPNITNNEEAIQQWGSFLGENHQSEILLVLDDVWSESVITDLMFKSPRYKILVTSRMTFKRFETYQLRALSDEDATRLFCDSAFSKNENEHNNIPDELVHQLDRVSISSIISTTILMLENLKKLSLIMCKIGNSFNQGTPNKLTSLCEIDIDSCDDLLTFPTLLCNVVSLKKLCITNCHELTSFPEEFGSLLNLEVLRVASCTKLIALPDSMRNLKKLRIIDLSDCLKLKELPLHIGELGSLQTIDVTGCEGLRDQLPKSLQDFDKVKLKVVCDEETSKVLTDFKNVKVVEKDPLDIFRKIIGYI